VPVKALAFAVVIGQGVGRGEIGFNPDGVHGKSIPGARRGVNESPSKRAARPAAAYFDCMLAKGLISYILDIR
jgi:hypothetical protein